MEGLEPSSPWGHTVLSRACLPKFHHIRKISHQRLRALASARPRIRTENLHTLNVAPLPVGLAGQDRVTPSAHRGCPSRSVETRGLEPPGGLLAKQVPFQFGVVPAGVPELAEN